MDRSPSTEEDWPQEGMFCTLKLLKKADGTELQRYPVDGERTTFGRDPSNDVRIYYPDISRFQCELVFDSDRKPFLKVLGKTGVLINGNQIKPPAEIALKEGDTFEMRKKRWLLCLPSEGIVQAMKQVEISTPRRRRPSTRFSIIPPDLTFSPYAAHDAAARLPASPIGSLRGMSTQSSSQQVRREVPQSMSPQESDDDHEDGDEQSDSSDESAEHKRAEERKPKTEKSASRSIATRFQESIWMPRRFSNPLSSKNKGIHKSQTTSPNLQTSLSDTQLGRKRKTRSEEEETEEVSNQQATPRSVPLPVSLETPYAPSDGTPVRRPLINKTPSSTAGRTPHSSAKAPSSGRPSIYPALPPAPISYRTAQSPSTAPSSTSLTEERLIEHPSRSESPTSSSREMLTPKSPEVHANPLPSLDNSSVEQSITPSTPGASIQQTPKNLTATKGPNSLRKAILMRSARKVLFGQKDEPVVVKDEMIGNVKIRRRSSTGPGNQDVFDDTSVGPVSSIFGFEPDSESSDEEEEEDIEKENEPTKDVASAADQPPSIGPEDEEYVSESDEKDSAESTEEEHFEENLPDKDSSDEGSADNESINKYADQEISIGSIGESESDDEVFEEIEKSLILEISSGSESEEEEKPDLKLFKVKKEETSLDDIVPPGPSRSTALSTPQAARPVQTRFYTPQAISSADFKVNMSRTLGPPVQVPNSASKPRNLNPLSKVWKEEAGRRSSLGPPLRVHRVRTVEEDVDEEIKDEKEALRKVAAKRRESAIILASAPRQLPKISEFDMKDLQSPRKKPFGTPLAEPALNDSSSDEERTPLQLLAKKAERLRRKSMARQSMSGAMPYSPSAPGTPLRALNLLTSTPTSSLNRSSLPPFGSHNLQPSHVSARPEPPTPNMGGLRHLFSTSSAVPSTPRFGGMRSLFKEPIVESPSTPHLAGVESIFQLPQETKSFSPHSSSALRPSVSGDELLSQTEESLHQKVTTKDPDESLLIISEDSLLGLDQAVDSEVPGAVIEHEEIIEEHAENDANTTLPSTPVSDVTTVEVINAQDSEMINTELPRVKTRQTSTLSTTTVALESESTIDSGRPDISSSPAPPALPSPPRTRRATSRAASEQPSMTWTDPPIVSLVSVSKLPARRITRAASATPSTSSTQAPAKSTRSASTVKKESSILTGVDWDQTRPSEQPTNTSNRRTASALTRTSQEPVDANAMVSRTRRTRVPVPSTSGSMTSNVMSVKAEPAELDTLEEDEDVLEMEAPVASSSRARSTKTRLTATAVKGNNSLGSGVMASELRPNREDGSSLPIVKKRRTATNSSIEDDKENETAKHTNQAIDSASNMTVNVKSVPISKLVPPKPIGRTTRARAATAELEEQSSEKVTGVRASARVKK